MTGYPINMDDHGPTMTWVGRIGALSWAAFGLRYALASADILPPPNVGNWWLAVVMFLCAINMLRRDEQGGGKQLPNSEGRTY